jgi:hypothetical protein
MHLGELEISDQLFSMEPNPKVDFCFGLQTDIGVSSSVYKKLMIQSNAVSNIGKFRPANLDIVIDKTVSINLPFLLGSPRNTLELGMPRNMALQKPAIGQAIRVKPKPSDKLGNPIPHDTSKLIVPSDCTRDGKEARVLKRKQIHPVVFESAANILETQEQLGLKKAKPMGLARPSKFISPLGSKKEPDNTADPRLKNVDKSMVETVMNEVMHAKTVVKWTDICGLDHPKKTLREIVVLPMLRPDLFTGLRSPPKGLLLFGPPGTGKTLIGKCVASQCNGTFFSISSSSLTSKWIGDGEVYFA